MVFGNGRYVKEGGAAIKPSRETLNIDNKVLSTVEREYKLMEQEHARYRAQTLATHSRENQSKGLQNPTKRLP